MTHHQFDRNLTEPLSEEVRTVERLFCRFLAYNLLIFGSPDQAHVLCNKVHSPCCMVFGSKPSQSRITEESVIT